MVILWGVVCMCACTFSILFHLICYIMTLSNTIIDLPSTPRTYIPDNFPYYHFLHHIFNSTPLMRIPYLYQYKNHCYCSHTIVLYIFMFCRWNWPKLAELWRHHTTASGMWTGKCRSGGYAFGKWCAGKSSWSHGHLSNIHWYVLGWFLTIYTLVYFILLNN